MIHVPRPRTPSELMLPTEAETVALARRLSPLLRPGDALLLSGPIGAGKSTFARALIRARLKNPAEEVPSPTFTLVQTYDDPAGDIWHCDLYRLGGPDEALELGLHDAFRDAICLIEWPDRLGPLAPPGALGMTFGVHPTGHRVVIAAPPGWATRIGSVLG